MAGDRPDAVLLVCKAAGMSLPTAKSVTSVRRDGQGPPNLGFDSAFANYERLSASTAQPVVRFWQVRQNG